MRFMNTPNGFEFQTRLDSASAEFQTALELHLEPFFMNTGTGLLKLHIHELEEIT